VRECLERRGVGAAEIDLIVVATVTPDMLFPATACVIQDKIGASRAWGFDISAACSGFVYALTTGAQFVQAGSHRKVLVVGADVMTSILNFQDRSTCVLFGDGAGAVLLEPSTDGTGVLDFANEVDGSGGTYLRMDAGGSLYPASHETVEKRMHYIRQEGAHVFKYAVRKFAESTAAILERNGVAFSDLDLLVPHQANVRIIDAARDRLGLSDDKVVKNISRYGNTTAATIPLALGTALDEGRLHAGDLVLMAAVGAGFTVGTTLVRWTGVPWT
jgi:3-oxoacyl-[acyl-carrier-protein] synthase-3